MREERPQGLPGIGLGAGQGSPGHPTPAKFRFPCSSCRGASTAAPGPSLRWTQHSAALTSYCVIGGPVPRGHPGDSIPRDRHRGGQEATAGLGKGLPHHDPRDPLCYTSPHTLPTTWTDTGDTGDAAEDLGGAPCEPGTRTDWVVGTHVQATHHRIIHSKPIDPINQYHPNTCFKSQRKRIPPPHPPGDTQPRTQSCDVTWTVRPPCCILGSKSRATAGGSRECSRAVASMRSPCRPGLLSSSALSFQLLRRKTERPEPPQVRQGTAGQMGAPTAP